MWNRLSIDLYDLLLHWNVFVSKQKYPAYKYHWSGIGLPTTLEITPCSLDQLDPTSNKVIASYDYKDIVATIGKHINTLHLKFRNFQNIFQQIDRFHPILLIIGIQDYDQGIVIAYGKFTRLHLFRANNHHEIVQNVVQASNQYMNVALKVVPSQITLSKFEQEKFGPYSYVCNDFKFIDWNIMFDTFFFRLLGRIISWHQCLSFKCIR